MLTSRFRARAFLVTVLALAGGCGSGGGSGEALGEQALSDLSRLESATLVDKSVSQAELEEAGQAFAECLEANQFSVEFSGSPRGPDQVTADFTVAASLDVTEAAAEEDRIDVAYDSCRSEVNAVSAVWVLQNQASAEEIQAAIEDFPACLASAGLEISEDTSAEEAYAAAEEFREKPTADSNLAEVDGCLATLNGVAETALPGLAEALAELEITGSG